MSLKGNIILAAVVLSSIFRWTVRPLLGAENRHDEAVSFVAAYDRDSPGRSFHDIPVKLDMTGRRGVTFDFRCDDTKPFTSMTCHLRSGSGWYSLGSFEPGNSGEWKTVEIPFIGARREGVPSSPAEIDLLRISAWRITTNETECAVARIGAFGSRPGIVIIRADSVIKGKRAEEWPVKTLTHIMYDSLKTLGFDVATVSDMDLDDDSLSAVHVAIFPYNPELPKSALSVLRRFAARGGKTLAVYTAKDVTETILGLKIREYSRRDSGWMALCEPPSVGRVVAEASGAPWIVKVPHGAFIARAWRSNADNGETGELLEKTILSLAPHLAAGMKERMAARRREIAVARDWVRSRDSRCGEKRAMWCHDPFGAKGWTWDESVKFLKGNGFNILVPNLCFAVTAYYKSKVIPVAPEVQTRGDQLAECLAACRKHGMECHVWRVCLNCGSRASAEFLGRMAADGRMQQTFAGECDPLWLCPNHPDNRTLEIEAISELAGKGVDGVHLDYIRYPGKDGCFCARCRSLFEHRLGRAVVDWPADVRKIPELGKAWTGFRCNSVSTLVGSIAERIRRDFPGVKISAAVAGNLADGVNDRGQDWVSWCKNGWLDFVCPMDYTSSTLAFSSAIAMQSAHVGKALMLPGIGLSCWEDASDDDVTMTRHIETVRKAGLDGFIVFDFNMRAIKSLPALRAGVLQKD